MVSYEEIGWIFTNKYYTTLKNQPEMVPLFYNNSSTMLRIVGDSIVRADTTEKIMAAIGTLNFTSTEIRTVDTLLSMGGGITVLVSGYVTMMSNYDGQRKFVQSFFLAPQPYGYYVLSDIFRFLDEDVTPNGDDQGTPRADEKLQVESSSSKINESVDDCSGQEVDGELKYVYMRNLPHSVNAAQLEQVFTQFGTIKPDGIIIKSRPDIGARFAFVYFESMAAVHDALRASPIELDGFQIYIEEPRPKTLSASQEENDLKSVFVRNLPYYITAERLEQEFKQFGAIKPDGIIIRSGPDISVCYALVYFESMAAVHAALQRSPMKLDGNKIHIEERRAKASGGSRGGRSGGRGSGGRGSGRGSNRDGSDNSYNRPTS